MKVENVHLHADAIDRPTASFEIFEHGIKAVRLGIYRFTLSVVIKKESVGVGGMRPAQGLLDVGGSFSRESNSGSVIPDRLAEFCVLIEFLVQQLPGKSLPRQ